MTHRYISNVDWLYCSPVILRARVATESVSSPPTLCRGSGQERECGGSSRAFPATEREDTWPWGNPRCADIIMPLMTYSALFFFNFALLFLSFMFIHLKELYWHILGHWIILFSLWWPGSIYLFVVPTLSCAELQGAGAYPSTHWVSGRIHPGQSVIKGLAPKWPLCRHYKGSSCPVFTAKRYIDWWDLGFSTGQKIFLRKMLRKHKWAVDYAD